MKIDKKLLCKMAQGCINSYGGEYGEIKQIFDSIEKFQIDNVQGYFGFLDSEPENLYIIFRGSDEKLDWKQNFKFKKLPIIKMTNGIDKMETPYKNVNPKIKIHKGFSTDYKKIRKIILDKCQNKYKTIIITGHSKGGTLTIFSAVDIQYNFSNKEIICITFGCPRVGNKFFKKSYNKRVPKTLRIVNGEDYITKLPLAIQGYKHVGKLLKISRINPLCWIPIIRVFGSFYHYPQKYLKNIKKLPDNYLFE